MSNEVEIEYEGSESIYLYCGRCNTRLEVGRYDGINVYVSPCEKCHAAATEKGEE